MNAADIMTAATRMATATGAVTTTTRTAIGIMTAVGITSSAAGIAAITTAIPIAGSGISGRRPSRITTIPISIQAIGPGGAGTVSRPTTMAIIAASIGAIAAFVPRRAAIVISRTIAATICLWE